MKKLIYTLLITVTSMQAIAQQTNFDIKYLQKDNTYHFNDETRLTISTIFTKYKSEFGLTDFDEMKVERTIVEEEKTHTKFVQYHKGYIVENYMMNANGQNGIILSANGMIAKNLNVNVTNILKEEDALRLALEKINATLYPWQDAEREKILKENTENPNATAYPKGELVIVNKGIYDNNSEFCLAWKFGIETIEPNSLNSIYINANNGTYIYNLQTENHYNYNNSGTGWTWYNGYFSNLGTGKCNLCSNYTLNSNNGISTGNPSGDAFKDNNNNWVENEYGNTGNFTERKTAHSAHWILERTRDYYLHHFGRWGSDYNGKGVVVLTRQTIPNYLPASYSIGTGGIAGLDKISVRKDNTNIAQPSGTNAGIGYSGASFDVLAHEYAHAMIRRSSQLINYGEPGALNEGFADIFGILAEKYTFGTFNWSIGENVGIVRYFDNPNNDYELTGNNLSTILSTPSPSYWGQNSGFWWKTSQYSFPQFPLPLYLSDNTIYSNSGVLRKWFYLLANGGSQTINGVTWTVPAIGIDKAEKIAYLTFNWYCWSTSHYIDAANGSIQATIDFYGNCSPEHKAVAAAWRAVTNNYPIPLCKRFNIDGLNVVKTQNLQNSPVKYTIRFDETIGNPANIVWTIPQGWNVSIDGANLTLKSTTNTTSQKLVASYSEDGTTYTNNIVVHFSDENITGDNRMPENKMSNSDNALDKDKFSIYPNPANDKIAIVLPYGLQNSTYQLLDINGRVLQQGAIYQQATELNISLIANGIYILQVKADNYSQVQKVNIIH